jgi:hypothetical protein
VGLGNAITGVASGVGSLFSGATGTLALGGVALVGVLLVVLMFAFLIRR